MDKIINQIIAIEDMAQEVIRNAKEEQEKLDDLIKQDIAERKDEIEKKVKEKSETIAEFEKRSADEKIAGLEKKLEVEKKQLEKIYAENKNKWVENIFNNIVNS